MAQSPRPIRPVSIERPARPQHNLPAPLTRFIGRGGEVAALTGPGAALLTVSGNHAVRVFSVNSGVTASISSLTIANGNAANDSGGGINNAGTLTVTNSALAGNSAISNGVGGGIYNTGTMTVTNTTLSGNSASYGGGIYSGIFGSGGTMTVTNSTLSGNSATTSDGMGGFGGGIENVGTLTVTNSIIAGNSAAFDGGGIENLRACVQSQSARLQPPEHDLNHHDQHERFAAFR